MARLTPTVIAKHTDPESNHERFTYDDMYAAMSIIEEIIRPVLADAGAPWTQFREAHGIGAVRDVVIEMLAGSCDRAWTKAYAAYESACEEYSIALAESGDGTTTVQEPRDPGSFDYGFVPFWLRQCVDWSECGPRV